MLHLFALRVWCSSTYFEDRLLIWFSFVCLQSLCCATVRRSVFFTKDKLFPIHWRWFCPIYGPFSDGHRERRLFHKNDILQWIIVGPTKVCRRFDIIWNPTKLFSSHWLSRQKLLFLLQSLQSVGKVNHLTIRRHESANDSLTIGDGLARWLLASNKLQTAFDSLSPLE